MGLNLCLYPPLYLHRRLLYQKGLSLENQEAKAPYVRADVCVLPAISVIGEAVMAEVLCRFFLMRFGGDCMEQVYERFKNS